MNVAMYKNQITGVHYVYGTVHRVISAVMWNLKASDPEISSLTVLSKMLTCIPVALNYLQIFFVAAAVKTIVYAK